MIVLFYIIGKQLTCKWKIRNSPVLWEAFACINCRGYAYMVMLTVKFGWFPKKWRQTARKGLAVINSHNVLTAPVSIQ